jgi:hypothetical protein
VVRGKSKQQSEAIGAKDVAAASHPRGIGSCEADGADGVGGDVCDGAEKKIPLDAGVPKKGMAEENV